MVCMNLEQEEGHCTLFSSALWGLTGKLDLNLSLRQLCILPGVENKNGKWAGAGNLTVDYRGEMLVV